MKGFIWKGFILAAATLVGTLSASAARALQLTPEQLTQFDQYVQTERKAFTNLELSKIDASKLRWSGAAESLEVYFVNEAAGYRNQLLLSANGGPLATVFNDVSSTESILSEADGPLKRGEGKSVGSFSKGTVIDFFLNSDGYSRGDDLSGKDPASITSWNLLGADAAKNGDKKQHMIAYDLGGGWTLMGFEDIVGGGDLDFNDTVFVVRGVAGDKVSTPEPSIMLSLGAAAAMGLMSSRRRRQGAVEE
ncbi:MAG: DUF4114 domain-containing protein [Oscillatoriales cyanobacterium]|nr:MAG: DUF4114 domain-containing protein [Oscillatoriales cyanobacterium]